MPEERISIKQVYDAVIDVRTQVTTLNVVVQKNCTDIALLQQRDANCAGAEEKRDKRIESLDDAVRAIVLDNARAIRTSAIIAALITAAAGILLQFIK